MSLAYTSVQRLPDRRWWLKMAALLVAVILLFAITMDDGFV